MLTPDAKESRPDTHAFADRRLQRARTHVSKFWIPVNTGLLAKIRRGLDEGAYNLDLDFLYLEVRSDYALLTHCINHLTSLLKLSTPNLPPVQSPLELFNRAGLNGVRAIFNDERLFRSAHRLEHSEPEQIQRLKEVLISSSAAQVLSESGLIDPNVTHTTSLLRQLGHTLITWNYPEVYSEAAAEVSDERSLDDLLAQRLGFQPAKLAGALASEWFLAPPLQAVIGANGTLTGADKLGLSPADEALAAKLHQYCKAGEILAQATNPALYPNALKAIDKANQFIDQALGNNGFTKIREQLLANSESYLAVYPEIFPTIKDFDPAALAAPKIGRRLPAHNPHLAECPQRLSDLLQGFYRNLSQDGKIDRDSLAMLVRDIIPAAGFSGGCIFIFDEAHNALSPRMKIRETQLLECEALTLTYADRSLPLARAFYERATVSANALSPAGKLVGYSAGLIGERRKAGVLYLEHSEALGVAAEESAHVFQAVLCALGHCLNAG